MLERPSKRPSPDDFLRIASQCADEARYDRVAPLFASAASRGIPADDAHRWHLLLVEAGELEAASALEPVEAGPDDTACVEPSAEDDLLDFDPGERVFRGDPAGDLAMERLLRWFAGREDVHAQLRVDVRLDRAGYRSIREPITPDLARKHLRGIQSVAQYLTWPDDSVAAAVLKLDPSLDDIRPGTRRAVAPHLQPEIADLGRRLLRACARTGLSPFVATSGDGGLRIWLLFEPRLAAATARAVAAEVLARAGSVPRGVRVEALPNQCELRAGGLGNLARLPLGVHEVTSRRIRFLDDDLEPLPDDEGLARLNASDPFAVRVLTGADAPAQHRGSTASDDPAGGRRNTSNQPLEPVALDSGMEVAPAADESGPPPIPGTRRPPARVSGSMEPVAVDRLDRIEKMIELLLSRDTERAVAAPGRTRQGSRR